MYGEMKSKKTNLTQNQKSASEEGDRRAARGTVSNHTKDAKATREGEKKK